MVAGIPKKRPGPDPPWPPTEPDDVSSYDKIAGKKGEEEDDDGGGGGGEEEDEVAAAPSSAEAYAAAAGVMKGHRRDIAFAAAALSRLEPIAAERAAKLARAAVARVADDSEGEGKSEVEEGRRWRGRRWSGKEEEEDEAEGADGGDVSTADAEGADAAAAGESGGGEGGGAASQATAEVVADLLKLLPA